MRLWNWLLLPTSRLMPVRVPRPRYRSWREPLEKRTILGTATVTSHAGTGTGSLRATITAALSGDTIKFAQPISWIAKALGVRLQRKKPATRQRPGQLEL